MSIRVRRVDGALVALCAARSEARPDDIYLDDEVHYALAQKFWHDYEDMGDMPHDAEDRARREAEESKTGDES